MVTAGPGADSGPGPDRRREALERARRIAAAVPDPELPMLTVADLGVLRGVEIEDDGTVVARLTPTSAAGPAIAERRAEVAGRLTAAGFPDVRVVTVLDPPWSTDRITAEGRRKLTEHGIAPPGTGPVLLTLSAPPPAVPCPRCASADTEEISRFAATACTALRRCRACLEPFEHVKEL